MQPALGNFNGLAAVDTLTNINSTTPAPGAPVIAVNNDASVNTPAADAPPPSARNSNATSSKKQAH